MQDFQIIDPQFGTFVMFNAPVEKLCTGFRWAEGPVWFGDADCLLFSDIPNNRIMRWSESTGLSVYRQPANFTNGHTRDRQGRLISCEHGSRSITRTEYDGTITTLASSYDGKRLNSPNDIVVKSDGTIWFTDPHYGIVTDYEGHRAEQELPCHVYRFDPTTGALDIMEDSFQCPNGLCFSPDEKRLYIADTGTFGSDNPAQHIRMFDVAEDGTLSGGHIFHTIDEGVADGMRVDTDGLLWSSAADGVHCISLEGHLMGKILVPEIVSNICFGGRANARLFITGTTSVYSVFLNRNGC